MRFINSLLFSCLILSTTAIAQRKVLIEQFTNSGCPPCASNTPVIASYVNNNLSQVLMLSYHTSFPYLDSMYFENALQSDQRVSYYSVSGVPTSRIDGNYFSGNPLSMLSTLVNNRSSVAPRYSINFVNSSLIGSVISADVVFVSEDASNQTESLKAHIVIAEKDVQKSSYLASPGNNSETEYPWVVRKMLPDANGYPLVNTSLNGNDSIHVNFSTNNIKDLNKLRLIAFVQNNNTKEIFQAEISSPQFLTNINQMKSQYNELFSLYPSEESNSLNIKINTISSNSQFRIFDILGNRLYSENVTSEVFSVPTISYSNGIYLAQVENGYEVQTIKFTINR